MEAILRRGCYYGMENHCLLGFQSVLIRQHYGSFVIIELLKLQYGSVKSGKSISL
nr:hypothetical protein Iba_chr05cCG3850 [Ipomoea batatas]GMC96988.1 hypothetical protein Iba_chr05dCG2770 [Ipomoea batatas]GMC98690.1 hypothetical protein Iba_scaffold38198CG0260 [Ipomoea batatas]